VAVWNKWTVAADLVLAAHTLFALFAVAGGFFVLASGWEAVFHLPVVAWSSIVNLADWTCPLTSLEKRLRIRGGQTAFESDWLQHYIEPCLRPLGMPGRMDLVAGIFIVAWNLIVYSFVIWWLAGR
jgi:hypothetical protein